MSTIGGTEATSVYARMAMCEDIQVAAKERYTKAQAIVQLAARALDSTTCTPAAAADGMSAADAAVSRAKTERAALSQDVRILQQQRAQLSETVTTLEHYLSTVRTQATKLRGLGRGALAHLVDELEAYVWQCEERLSYLGHLSMKAAEQMNAYKLHHALRLKGSGIPITDDGLANDDESAPSLLAALSKGREKDRQGIIETIANGEGKKVGDVYEDDSKGAAAARGNGSSVRQQRGANAAGSPQVRVTRDDLRGVQEQIKAVQEKRVEVQLRLVDQQLAYARLRKECNALEERLRAKRTVSKQQLEEHALLEAGVRELRGEEAEVSDQKGAYARQYATRCVVQSWLNPAEESNNVLLQRIMGMQEGQQRMDEAMALLKATVIKFETDLRKMKLVSRLSERELETAFKAGHNEVKIGVLPCLSRDDVRAFQRGHGGSLLWPLTLQLLGERFPAHKVETVYAALQDMVLAYDAMSADTKHSLTTATDVIVNAHILYVIAQYIVGQRSEKWALKYLRMISYTAPVGN